MEHRRSIIHISGFRCGFALIAKVMTSPPFQDAVAIAATSIARLPCVDGVSGDWTSLAPVPSPSNTGGGYGELGLSRSSEASNSERLKHISIKGVYLANTKALSRGRADFVSHITNLCGIMYVNH